MSQQLTEAEKEDLVRRYLVFLGLPTSGHVTIKSDGGSVTVDL